MRERLTDAAIREAMARAEKATPGCGCEPAGWTTLPGHGAVIGAGDCLHHVCSSSYVSEFADPICEFIAAARTDVPALAAEALARGTEVEGLRAEVARLTAERDEANAACLARGNLLDEHRKSCAWMTRAEAAEAEVARLRAAAIPEDAEEIVFKELSIGVFEPQDLEIQEAIHAKRRAKARAVVKALRRDA